MPVQQGIFRVLRIVPDGKRKNVFLRQERSRQWRVPEFSSPERPSEQRMWHISYAAACSGAVPCFAGTWGDMKKTPRQQP